MSEKSNDKTTSDSKTDEEKNQMLFNIVDKEERSKRYPADEEVDKMDEFNTWAKRYNQVSKEIRKNAIDQEKKELEELEKSPLVRYYQGSRDERIQALDEEQKQLEAMESLKFAKGKK